MFTKTSALPIFGLWVVWVYLLSLVALRGVESVQPAPLRPSVRFVDADKAFLCPTDTDANILALIAAELS